MGQFGVGQSVSRTDDPKFLRGRGSYADDMVLPGQLSGYVVRSPHAHAEIGSIDIALAAGAKGVVAVLSAADYQADGIGPIPFATPPMSNQQGIERFATARPALAAKRARFAGDAVAYVVAENPMLARDAAQLIAIDYTPLPSVVETAAAAASGAPAVWDEQSNNVCFVHEVGDEAATRAAFATADHVVKQQLRISRTFPGTMEPRGCIADYNERGNSNTLYAGQQMVFAVRSQLAAIFSEPEANFRIVSGDAGGGFGTRGILYPELVLAMWASRRVGRPVKWIADRSEAFLSDYHGRDNISEAALALDAEGRFLGLRVDTTVNLGAYISSLGLGPTVNNLGTLAGTYTTPAAFVRVTGVFSHSAPTGPYRGAGRPEAACVIERIVDIAANELKMDAADIRRRNTIPASAMPYKTPIMFTYDCGDFLKNLEDALAMADYANFETRRLAASENGRLRGIGISNTVERAVIPQGIEFAEIRFDPGGGVTVLSGTTDQGQGHKTIFTQLLCDKLGLEPDQITVLEGDTMRASYGLGAGGSSVSTLGMTALGIAADKIIEKGRQVAAHIMETATTDIDFADGVFTISGTDKSASLGKVVATCFTPGGVPSGIEPGLYESGSYRADGFNFPNGCHVCEVEIDAATGAVALLKYVIVDDVGTVLNPLLLSGQIMGGVAQGAGQALMEDLRHDPASGQLLTGSYLDYCMPRADDFCAIEIRSNSVPTKTNPLGSKGGGEAGTVGALPAVLNAVNCALAPLGVTHFDMPATPERVWQAMRVAIEA